MYEIFIDDSFAAAHQIREYNGDCENMHGHNWKVKVVVKVQELDKLGLGIDFRLLKTKLKEVLELVDHKNLSQISPFNKINPTSENLAKFIYDKISDKIDNKYIKVSRIEVHESEKSGVIYYP